MVIKKPNCVVKDDGSNLLGRDWLQHLVGVPQIANQCPAPGVTEAPGCLQGRARNPERLQAKIHINPGVSPRFCKARSVLYLMYALVDKELDRLQEEGVIEPVQLQIGRHQSCRSSKATKPLSESVVISN